MYTDSLALVYGREFTFFVYKILITVGTVFTQITPNLLVRQLYIFCIINMSNNIKLILQC